MARTITIRLIDGKEEVYDKFKDTVVNNLHSDICYVTTMLMETFNQAILQNPKAEPIIMKLVKQNVQINMGCTFQYYTKKARRIPNDAEMLRTNQHNLIPDLIEQFPTLSKKAQDYWIKELEAQGFKIKAPSISTGEAKVSFIQKLRNFWSIVKHLFA